MGYNEMIVDNTFGLGICFGLLKFFSIILPELTANIILQFEEGKLGCTTMEKCPRILAQSRKEQCCFCGFHC
jgi:hypothetical protein